MSNSKLLIKFVAGAVVMAAFILVACQTTLPASTTNLPASRAATSTPPTDTLVPTDLTRLPQQPTPDFRDAPVYPKMLIAKSEDPSCQLPCWQGLRVGISDKNDVQSTLSKVFGFSYPIDFFSDTPRPNDPSVSVFGLDIPGTEAGGYLWATDSTPLLVYALVDQESGKLSGIKFSQKPYTQTPNKGGYQLHTAQQVIQELGKPSAAYIDANVKGGGRLMLVYFSGIVDFAFYTAETAPVVSATDNGKTKKYVNLCLDQQPFIAEDYITQPFNAVGKMNLDLIQYTWFGNAIGLTVHPSESFGITVDMLTEAALQNHPPCVKVNL